jgi:hypothetical protein
LHQDRSSGDAYHFKVRIRVTPCVAL